MIENGQKSQKKHYNESSIFLQSQPDFYIVLGDKIYPTHLYLMRQSNYICRQTKHKPNSFILKLNIENQIFQFVLTFIYDKNTLFRIRRDFTAVHLIKAALALELPTLSLFIEEDIRKQFPLYNIFVLYTLAEEGKISWLADKCDAELINGDFKQIKDYLTQFLKLSKQFLVKILKNHQKLKKSGQIKGLTQQDILQIVTQYCKDKNKNLKSQILFELQQNLTEDNLSQSITSQSIESLELSKKASKTERLKIEKKQSSGSKKIDNSLRDSILEYDEVKSPMVTLDELEERAQISWNKWSNQQEDKFMAIDNDQFGEISEKDSEEEDDRAIESSQKQIKKKAKLIVPQINKNFSL